MAVGKLPVVGLDIGTSAVRGAQVTKTKSGAQLTRFGQVALPAGAVSDGEIVDAGAVSQAVAQLWKRSKFRTKKVVIGVANQRVIVRQVDLPYLEPKEFKSSVKFQVADHIPISVDDAELGYEILGEFASNDQRMMRVLLVAGATEMIKGFVDAVVAAGVTPVGVDVTPFAVARAVSPAARGEVGATGAEAIVDVGAGVTNILVHVGGEPRFVRILPVGGDDTSRALAEELEMSFEEAEALKFDLGLGVGPDEPRRVLDRRVESLVSEIRGSLDYYLSQEDSEPVTSLVLTGGGAMTPGLAQQLEAAMGIAVHSGTALEDIDVTKSGLTPEQVHQVAPVAAAAVGLALGEAAR